MIAIAANPPPSSSSLPPPRRSGGVGRNRPVLCFVWGTASAAAVALLDFATAPHIHVGPLYIVPVVLAAWYGGRWPGYAVSVLTTAAWMQVGRPMHDPDESGRDYVITMGIRLLFYPAMVEVLLQLRRIELRLRRAVERQATELQREVADRHRAQATLRELAAQLSAAEDAERRRIAYDIHDALSQSLGVAKLTLETVVAETAIDTRQYDRLTDVVSLVDGLIRQTRELTFDLHPSMLDHFGLVPTLQQYGQEFTRRTMAELIVTESGEPRRLPTSLAAYLFRSIKELLNNAVKHGNAKEVVATAVWSEAGLRVVVDDDGIGCDPVVARLPQPRRGLGLAGIDERLTSLGGRLSLESQPGHGTRVIIEVPSADWAA